MTRAQRLSNAPNSDQERRNRPSWEGMEEQSEAVQFLSAMGVRFQRGEKVRVVFFRRCIGRSLDYGRVALVGWWYSGGDTMVRVTTGDTQLEGLLSSDRQREREREREDAAGQR